MKLNLPSIENLQTVIPDPVILVDKNPIITTVLIMEIVNGTLNKISSTGEMSEVTKEQVNAKILEVLQEETK